MNSSNIIMYTTEDGLTKIEVTFEEDTVWLSLEQMTELFQRDKSTISRHIKNIFAEGELSQGSTVAKYATVQMEGTRQVSRDIEYYNLDVKAEESVLFFKQVQNKMHWAAHQHTAAEIVFQRADAEKENMGLTTWEGKQIKRSDTEIAKNYMSYCLLWNITS